MTENELAYMSITEQASLIEKKEISPVDLVKLYLKRIEKWDGILRSWITVCGERALDQAKKAETEIAKGNYRGPMHSIPYGVNDQICTRDIPTTLASIIQKDFGGGINATVIDKLDEAYLILFSVVLSALFIFMFGMPLARYSQKITFVPTKILVPIIVVLLFMGSYAWRNSAFDILLMIFFGILGTVLKAYDYPIPAMLLALILGPIIEPNFLRALSIGGAKIFFTSPIVLVLWAFTLLSLIGTQISKLRRKR